MNKFSTIISMKHHIKIEAILVFSTALIVLIGWIFDIGVLRKIKSDEHMKTIPVVVLTSSREERDMVESYALGVNSYVTKPVEFEEFVKSVSELGLYWILINRTPE